MRAASGADLSDAFRIESYRVITEWRAEPEPIPAGAEGGSPVRLVHPWESVGELMTEATVKVHVGGKRVVATAEGNGPVNALDTALRLAVEPQFAALRNVHLTDYRVRVLHSERATGAVTRVLLDTSDVDGTWSTIGVSENIIEASWEALVDSVVVGLVRSASREARHDGTASPPAVGADDGRRMTIADGESGVATGGGTIDPVATR